MATIWQDIRADFPTLKKVVYLDHASGGPIPAPVAEKIQQYFRENVEEADFAWFKWLDRREKVRVSAAKFINASPEEITFIHSTSQGMNLIAELLAPLGQVLLNESEFPSSTLPWIWRKANMVWQRPEQNELRLNTLQNLLTHSVKTIVSSFVQYATGFRQDLENLGKLKDGRYLVVNATQGFGALPVDVEKWSADFLCTNSYKWLMAGYGSGLLYIRKKWLEKFQPLSIGWRSMNDPEKMNNKLIDVRPDAGRYEIGCPPFPSIFALGAAIDYLSQIGMDKIETRILELTDYLIAGIEKRGFEVLTPKAKQHRSGIVIFRTKEAEKIREKMIRAKIYVSARGEGIRIAPHFYNSLEDCDAFLKVLES